jgi:hypothetical protein
MVASRFFVRFRRGQLTKASSEASDAPVADDKAKTEGRALVPRAAD